MTVEAQKETMEFQTEVRQLLNLMIHSLYSNKEIFLRELVSNASDANDKLRFEAIQNDALNEGDAELRIRLAYDKEARTVTVSDNGIGMNREDVINNIGTIASSGTKKFVEALSGDNAKDSNLIGQFGVGFYSAFIVADKVDVFTRKAGDDAANGVHWSSTGEGEFSIENVEKDKKGTEIVLHIKEDLDEFLDGHRLRSVISKYSDHVAFPIVMASEDEEKQGEDETINKANALWKKSKSEISAEEYTEFYKNIFFDYEEPMKHMHNHVEGKQAYTTLFYIPKRAPFDLWDREKQTGIKLYVRRVFIMDDAEHLMPQYLRFVRGLVDSDDLPLNVSREILQRNKLIDSIRAASVKRILGTIENIAANEPEQYQEFWDQFGQVMKEGPAEDFANKDRIAKLLRFSSTHADGEKQTVSLEDYVSRMKEGQDKIYYTTAESLAAAKNSPHLGIFAKKGIEVLLLVDRVDEWMVSHLSEFDDKKLQSISKGDLDLGELEGEEEKQELEKAKTEFGDIAKRMQDALGERVKEVRVTKRLTDAPSCLVVEDNEMAINLQRMLASAGHAVPQSKPILEINPDNGLVSQLKNEEDDARFSEWSELFYEQALLSEAGQLNDPSAFVKRVNSLLLGAQSAGK